LESGADADRASRVPARQRDHARDVVHGRAHDPDDRRRDARDVGPFLALRRRARSVVSAPRKTPTASFARAVYGACLAATVAGCGGTPAPPASSTSSPAGSPSAESALSDEA